MSTPDLDEAVFGWEHPDHEGWQEMAANAVRAAVVVLVLGLVFVLFGNATLTPPGPEPVNIDCRQRPDVCDRQLPEAFDALPDAESVREAAIRRIQPQLVAAHSEALDEIGERHHIDEYERWETPWAIARMEWKRQLRGSTRRARSEYEWRALLTTGIPDPPPEQPLPDRPWKNEVEEAAFEAARYEVETWEGARAQVRTQIHKAFVGDQQTLEHAVWAEQRSDSRFTWLGLLLVALAVPIGLAALHWRRQTRVTQPFDMIVGRHSVRFQDQRLSLVDATDADLIGLLREMHEQGFRQNRPQALLDALEARRDAAERGAPLSAEDRAALAAILQS